MRVAFLSPLPPSRTGIAHYAGMLLPALRARLDVTAFESLKGYDRDAYDVAIYQLGNNPHHEWIYREAMEHPGIVVLHDMVLHHLIVEMTLARGDADAYVRALGESHGEAGEAWARGRTMGLHAEIGNFLFPASVALVNRSRAAVVHNEWAAARLRSFGISVPLNVIPHPADPAAVARPGSREVIRARYGISDSDRVIGVFGFLTSAKRGGTILEAYSAAADARLRLLIVGEPAPNIDASALARPGIITTGYVPDSDFADYYAAADRFVNLRYPSAGETSGTVIRAFAAGKPVAVSDYAQFAELPDDCAVKIPLGEGEVAALVRFFTGDMDHAVIASAQQRWLDRSASLGVAVEGYERAISGSVTPPDASGVTRALPLFPRLAVIARDQQRLTVQNIGESTLRTREYGVPGYRILAKLFEGEREVGDRWIELTGDLAPGHTASLDVPFAAGTTLRLYHAIEGIPMLEPEAWHAEPL